MLINEKGLVFAIKRICRSGSGACWGIPLYLLGRIERDPVEHTGAEAIDEGRHQTERNNPTRWLKLEV